MKRFGMFFLMTQGLFLSKAICAQDQPAFYKKPVWSCSSKVSDGVKKYELNIHKRKGDNRFQFILTQAKPNYRLIDSIAAEAKSENTVNGPRPTNTYLSKLFSFSFALDLKSKTKEENYAAQLIFDNSYKNKAGVAFTENAPLKLTCYMPK